MEKAYVAIIKGIVISAHVGIASAANIPALALVPRPTLMMIVANRNMRISIGRSASTPMNMHSRRFARNACKKRLNPENNMPRFCSLPLLTARKKIARPSSKGPAIKNEIIPAELLMSKNTTNTPIAKPHEPLMAASP